MVAVAAPVSMDAKKIDPANEVAGKIVRTKNYANNFPVPLDCS